MIKKFSLFLETITFQYHKELSHTFWTDFKFDEKVRKKLIRIAEDFFNNLETGLEIKDIRLPGSLSNYNYTKFSDLDVHIIIDLSESKSDIKILKKMVDDEKWIWNIKHNINIRSHDVELYVQDINESEITGGLFSLLNNEWIKKPDYKNVEVDEKLVELKYQSYVYQIEKFEEILKDEHVQTEWEQYWEMIQNFRKKVVKSRKDGLSTKDAEFSTENLVYKEIRNNGYLDRMWNLETEFYDKIFIQ